MDKLRDFEKKPEILCKRCKEGKLEYIDTMYLDYKDSYQKIAHPYYKCNKCNSIWVLELEELIDG